MDTQTIIIIILSIALVGLSAFVISLHMKLKKFLIGTSSTNLDESLASVNSSLEENKKFQKDMKDYLETVERRVKKSIQSVQTVRFNPFKGTGSGSNQSFSTVFLNEEKAGVVISSLYSREHISIYSKPIVKGVSEYELSEEEKESLNKALSGLK